MLSSPVTYGETTYTNDTADYRLDKFKYEIDDYLIKDDFIYYSQYDTPDGSWYYGLEKAELDRHVYGVLVIEPDGARAIKERWGEFTKCKTICIDSNDKERYIRQINRGDEIMEISLRGISDNVAFMGIEREIDYTVTAHGENGKYVSVYKNVKCIKLGGKWYKAPETQ